jgi:hypothetical protein
MHDYLIVAIYQEHKLAQNLPQPHTKNTSEGRGHVSSGIAPV